MVTRYKLEAKGFFGHHRWSGFKGHSFGSEESAWDYAKGLRGQGIYTQFRVKKQRIKI